MPPAIPVCCATSSCPGPLIEATQRALAAGRPVIVDTRDDAPRHLARASCRARVRCHLDDAETAAEARRRRHHPLGDRDPACRPATGRRRRGDRQRARRPSSSFWSWCVEGVTPAAVFGFPVGFVGAAESKAALWWRWRALPFVTVNGRRGGSAMAGAALTAAAHAALPPPRLSSAHDRPAEAPPHGGPGGPAPWLTVVGCLPSGALAPGAPRHVLDAEAVFGPARLLEAVGIASARAPPLAASLRGRARRALLAHRGRATTVLASGDPLHHGVAATLLRDLAAGGDGRPPCPVGLLAGRRGAPLAAGGRRPRSRSTPRPREASCNVAAPGRRILALTRDGDAPRQIAAALAGAGYGDSPVTVLEALGGPDEAIRRTTRRRRSPDAMHPLNVLAVECRGGRRRRRGRRARPRRLRHARRRCAASRWTRWPAGAPLGHRRRQRRRRHRLVPRRRHRHACSSATPARVAAIRANLAATAHRRAPCCVGDAQRDDRWRRAPDAHLHGRRHRGRGAVRSAVGGAPPGGVFVSNAVTLPARRPRSRASLPLVAR